MTGEDGRTRNVCLGDVGYVDEDGGFRSLFNITVDATDELNAYGVPEGFVPVEYNTNLKSVKEDFLNPQPFCSKNVTVHVAEASASM